MVGRLSILRSLIETDYFQVDSKSSFFPASKFKAQMDLKIKFFKENVVSFWKIKKSGRWITTFPSLPQEVKWFGACNTARERKPSWLVFVASTLNRCRYYWPSECTRRALMQPNKGNRYCIISFSTPPVKYDVILTGCAIILILEQ